MSVAALFLFRLLMNLILFRRSSHRGRAGQNVVVNQMQLQPASSPVVRTSSPSPSIRKTEKRTRQPPMVAIKLRIAGSGPNQFGRQRGRKEPPFGAVPSSTIQLLFSREGPKTERYHRKALDKSNGQHLFGCESWSSCKCHEDFIKRRNTHIHWFRNHCLQQRVAPSV